MPLKACILSSIPDALRNCVFYRRSPPWPIRIPSVCWSQALTLRALSALLVAEHTHMGGPS
jgi:hypothetical protein